MREADAHRGRPRTRATPTRKDAEVAADPAREAECATAAGWEDGVPEAEEGEKLHGIENAMAHVYENCLKNDAPGLVNALERLAANAARHEASEAEKAARAAERGRRRPRGRPNAPSAKPSGTPRRTSGRPSTPPRGTAIPTTTATPTTEPAG